MRNEEDLLPYFLRYYSTFADKIFIIDVKSTDKTIEIAKANKKVRLLDYKFPEGIDEEMQSRCFEKCYKKYSRGVADWVMAVDGDEFVYNKDLVAVLKEQQRLGRRVIKTTGYMMYSEAFPTTKGQIYKECYLGARSRLYDKKIVFDPLIDLKFMGGRHETILPVGVGCFRAKILLLHYRYLSLDSSIKRLYNSPHRFYNKKLIRNIKIALDRYEYGVASIKNGELIKVL